MPGPVTSKVSKGTAKLIKKGACLVESSDEILEEFGITASKKPTTARLLSKNEKKIVDLLETQRLSVDEIARVLGRPAGQPGSKLSLMVLKGILKESGNGKYYVS